MSSLLEQAVIDAKALKEAALKNAETAIIEKYAAEVKEAMSTILEQDEFGLEEEDPIADAPAEEMQELSQDPPQAFAEGENLCGCPDKDETIEVDLNQLTADMAKEEGALNGDDTESQESLAASMPLEEAAKPDFLDLDKDGDKEESMKAAAEDSEEEKVEENVEEIALDEDLLNDLLEKLTVDLNPQKSGWINRPDSEMEHAEDEYLAMQNDDEVKAEMEALRGNVEELTKENKNLINAGSILGEENEKLHAVIEEMHEKFNQVNISNAKLLYINRTLESISLNERQKEKIVEAISKADTAHEAKVIYETLQSTVGSTEKKSLPKSLSEAVSRKPSLIVSSKGKTKTLNEDFSMRMKRLAGITN